MQGHLTGLMYHICSSLANQDPIGTIMGPGFASAGITYSTTI